MTATVGYARLECLTHLATQLSPADSSQVNGHRQFMIMDHYDEQICGESYCNFSVLTISIILCLHSLADRMHAHSRRCSIPLPIPPRLFVSLPVSWYTCLCT